MIGSRLHTLFASTLLAEYAWFSIGAHPSIASRFQIPNSVGTALNGRIRTYLPTRSSEMCIRRRRRRMRRQSLRRGRSRGRHTSSLVRTFATIRWMRIQSPSLAIGSLSHIYVHSTTTAVFSSVDFITRLGRTTDWYPLLDPCHIFIS